MMQESGSDGCCAIASLPLLVLFVHLPAGPALTAGRIDHFLQAGASHVLNHVCLQQVQCRRETNIQPSNLPYSTLEDNVTVAQMILSGPKNAPERQPYTLRLPLTFPVRIRSLFLLAFLPLLPNPRGGSGRRGLSPRGGRQKAFPRRGGLQEHGSADRRSAASPLPPCRVS